MNILIRARFSLKAAFEIWLDEAEPASIAKLNHTLKTLSKPLDFISWVSLFVSFFNIIYQIFKLAPFSTTVIDIIIFFMQIMTLCFSIWIFSFSISNMKKTGMFDILKRDFSDGLPRNAEFLLWILVPRENRDAVIGDTREQFEVVCEKFKSDRFGRLWAYLWLWCEVGRSAWPLISAFVKGLIKCTFLGSVGDWVRRNVG